MFVLKLCFYTFSDLRIALILHDISKYKQLGLDGTSFEVFFFFEILLIFWITIYDIKTKKSKFSKTFQIEIFTRR